MSDQPRIVVENAPAVQAGFDQLAKDGADLSAPTRTVLAIGLDTARGDAPVKTGELRGSIDVVEVTPEGGTLAARAPYAGAQEYGTRRGVRGRHFMRAGADAVERAAPDVYRQDLEKKVRSAAQKA